jgi:4-amino-4-deoxy-L-arabinose transferase-like glycosyltransferase
MSPDPPAGPPTSPAERRLPAPLLAFLLAFAALAPFAWARDLWDADEGRYGAVALDMVRSGDYVTPREAGMRFMDKPPLLYWMEAGAIRVLGPVSFAARLPCLLAGAALATFVFLLARDWTGRERAAWFAAGVAATSAAGVGFSRVSPTTDMPLAAALTGALLFAQRALASDAGRWRVGLGACLGLALLAKGALAFAIPGVVALSWVVVGVDVRRVLRVALSPTAWAVALAIAAPWYALVEARNPGYLEHFLLYEHWGRFSEKGHRDFVPWWLYVPVLAGMVAPWTPFLVGARLPRALPVGRGGREVSATRLAWAWAVGVLLFLSVGKSKLFTYALPAVPPLLALAGARVEAVVSGARPRGPAFWALAVGLLVTLAGLALASGYATRRGWLPEPRVADAGWLAAVGGFTLVSASVAAAYARSPAGRGALLFAGLAVLWWCCDLGAARLDDLRSARALAGVLVRESQPGDVVVTLDRYPQGLRWYADVDAKIAGRQREIVPPWSTLDGKGRLLSHDDLRALWKTSTRVLLVGRGIDLRVDYPDGRHVAGPLAGAQRTDLYVVSNR